MGKSEADFHMLLGKKFYIERRVRSAIAEYLKALNEDPLHAVAHVKYGYALQEEDDIEQEIVELREKLFNNADDLEARFRLGDLLYTLDQDVDAQYEWRQVAKHEGVPLARRAKKMLLKRYNISIP